MLLGLALLLPVWAFADGRWTGASPSLQVAERVHTQYDRDLGWANIQGLNIPDMYGPGLRLATNSRGFRNDREFDESIPAGKRRVICSGDSFTLGYGVSQDENWCAELERLDPSLETVNMGQGGYGVDQSYLWFMRDGRKLDFDVQLFTFIYVDFERMRHPSFFGYQKPVLSIENGALVAHPAGAPDAKKKSLSPLMAFRIWLHQFEWVQWLETQARRHYLKIDDPQTRRVVSEIFRSLKAENETKESRLVAVYLPTLMDREETGLDELRDFLRGELRRQGIEFMDLTPTFRALDSKTFESLFLKGSDVRFAGAEGHYTAAGNRFVARLLQEALASDHMQPASSLKTEA
jgi:hypothetical protein